MTAEHPANQHEEPANGTALLGFIDGNQVGVWYRADFPNEDEPRRWYSTYVNPTNVSGYGFTYDEAVRLGARWDHEMWTSPTPDAYAAACRALDRHRAEVDRLRALLAKHGIAGEEATR